MMNEVNVSPAFKASFSAWGGSPRDILRARIEVQKAFKSTRINQMIEDATARTKEAKQKTEEQVSRKLPTSAAAHFPPNAAALFDEVA